MFNYKAPPTISKFMRSPAFARVLVGPTASGKTTGCLAEILRRCSEANIVDRTGTRLSKWAIVCADSIILRYGIINSVVSTFGTMGRINEADCKYLLRFNDVDAELIFIGLDNHRDVIRLVRSEFTGAYVCGGIPTELMHRVAARVGRYPIMADGPPSWYGVICELDRPDEGTPEYALAHQLLHVDAPPIEAEVFWQPSALSDTAENLDNLPKGYYNQIAVGKSSVWVAKHLRCDYSA